MTRIIRNGYILTCDASHRGGWLSLLIRHGRIAEISPNADVLLAHHDEAEVFDASGMVIVPGFVNPHVHSESVLLKGLTNGVPFGMWKDDTRLVEASAQLCSTSGFDDLRSVYLTSYFSHLKSGTTCVCEFGLPVGEEGFRTMVQAMERSDLRCVGVLQNWDQIRAIRDMKRTRFLINLGKEEDFTVYSFENLTRASRESGVPLVAHIAEQKEDAECVRKNFHKSVVAVLRDSNAMRNDTMLVHGNHFSEEEVDVLKQLGQTVVVSPRSAAFKQTGFPALRFLARRNVRLALATDWGKVGMLGEMQFLDGLSMVVPGIRSFSGIELLRMATINGAVALGMSHEIGSIEKDKKADLTFLDVRDLHIPQITQQATPDQVADVVVRQLSDRSVSHVMIGGEFYVSAGKIMTVAEEDIMNGFHRTAGRFSSLHSDTLVHKRSTTDVRTRIIPFVPSTSLPLEIHQPHQETDPGRVAEGPPMIPLRRHLRDNGEELKPELPKEVKKVFGEDDV